MWARFPRATVAIEHSWVLARIRKRQARILRSETGSSFSWTTIGGCNPPASESLSPCEPRKAGSPRFRFNATGIFELVSFGFVGLRNLGTDRRSPPLHRAFRYPQRATAPMPSKTRPSRIRMSTDIGPEKHGISLRNMGAHSGRNCAVRKYAAEARRSAHHVFDLSTTNRLYYASVRAPTLRYHAHVGGRTPSVSSADEEVRAGLGSREAAHSVRRE